MPRSSKKSVPKRLGRTKPSVIRTHLTIATGIANNGLTLDVRRDVELVKAGIMYADDVELLSLGSQALYSMRALQGAGADGVAELLATLPTKSLEILGVPPGQADLVIALLRNLEAFERVTADSPEAQEGAAQLREQLGRSARELEDVIAGMLCESGGHELEEALRRGTLRINQRPRMGQDTTVEDFMGELKQRVEEPNRMLLADDQAATMVRHMIEEGVARPSRAALLNAAEVLVGSGLVARLPYFPEAPLDELLDMRSDLEEELVRYRRAVSGLQQHLESGPFDRDRSGEVDRIWRTEVEPALTDVKASMADHGLAREVLSTLGRDPKSLVGVVLPGASMALLAHASFHADSAASLVGGAVTAAVTVGVQALYQRDEGRTAISRGDLYYLAEVGDRLDQTATG